jgi:hypothetical protein
MSHHVRKTYKTILQISTQLVASRQEWFSFLSWMLGLRKNPSNLSASKNLLKLPLKTIRVTVVLFIPFLCDKFCHVKNNLEVEFKILQLVL